MYPASVDARQENHTQSVHLHMHHFCPCLNMMYQYCLPTYRPSIVPYPQSRPYNLHHYQYTQYNMLPFSTAPHAAVIPPPPHVTVATNPHGQAHFAEVVFGPPSRDRRNLDRTTEERNETNAGIEKTSNTEYSPLSPTVEVGASTASGQETQEGARENNLPQATDAFIKFLEDSCLRAEHIAYRNRNRPCFRNIQNLCIRTRNEILKPCTTISNIHSQGIPWATKDFIYAFIRLINCWHILKGYLEKDGSLGKIEKELTADFKACYYKWEKDSMELAEELRRIFCNLDANISNPNTGGNNANANSNPQNFEASAIPSNHVPSAMHRSQNGGKRGDNLLNSPPKEGLEPKVKHDPLLHFDSSESSLKEEDSIYMKPGSYNVPRKNDSSNNDSPRSFEFLETAQNTHKLIKDKQDSVDKIWQNAQTAVPNLISRMVPTQKPFEGQREDDILFGAAVQTWIDTGLYPTTGTDKTSASFDNSKPITVLQRSKAGHFDNEKTDHHYFPTENYTLLRNSVKDNFVKPKMMTSKIEITSRTYRKRVDGADGKLSKRMVSSDGKIEEENGFSREAMVKFKEILSEMKTTELSFHLNHRKVEDDKEGKFPTTLTAISKKIEDNIYRNIDEIVHDFRYLTLHAKLLFKDEDCIMATITKFVQKFERAIATAFPEVEFNHVSGERSENAVSAHQNRKTRNNDGDGDH